MSTSLSYETASQVGDKLRDQIRTHVEAAASGYEWWCESICFFDHPDKRQHLTGDTKLFLLLDDPAIDSFMAHADAMKIAECLASASREFGVSWNLSLGGAPVGTISNGTLEDDVLASLNSLLDFCTMMGVEPTELNRTDILASYADR